MKRLLPILGMTLFSLPALALECDEGMRAFEHMEGETCIPATPQRIVATRHDSLALLTVGRQFE